MAISMTEAAAKHVQRSLEGRGKGEVSVLACAPLAVPGLPMSSNSSMNWRPRTWSSSHGVKVIIDPKSLVYLDGTELDFTREGLNEGFKFNNPNVRGECGCGESFNV